MVKRRWPVAVEILIAVGIFALLAINIAPIAWGVLASFKPEPEILKYPPSFLPTQPTLENYRLVAESDFVIGLRNSALYALASVVVGLSAGSLAAFGFDRFAFPGRRPSFLLVVASIPLAIGAAALLVPNYLFFAGLGLTNHWYTLPLIYTVHSLPLAIWIIKGGMEGIPRELDEAAYVDGASSMMVFRKIVLPLCRPAIAAAGLLLSIYAWNEFVAGSVMVDAKELRPIQPLLYAYFGFFGRQWGELTAAATIAVLPIFVIYGLFGRLLIAGMNSWRSERLTGPK